MTNLREQLRQETERLLQSYQGDVTKCPTKLAKGSDDRMFVHSRQSAKEQRLRG